MKKTYRFNGKNYIVQSQKAGVIHPCIGCAFRNEPGYVCRDFERTGAPECVGADIIFIEKQAIKSVPKHWNRQSAITKEPIDKTVESVKVNINPPKFAMSNNTVLQYRKESTRGVTPTEKTEIRTDRVIADTKNIPNAWSFQLRMDNGYRPASVSVIASKTAENCKFTAATLPDTERFIVCSIENGNLAPSTSPKQHKSRESAEKEAERLCKLYHQEFAVLQVVSAIKPQEPKKEVFA